MSSFYLEYVDRMLEQAEDSHDSFAIDYWYREREKYYRENGMSRKDSQLENFYAGGL